MAISWDIFHTYPPTSSAGSAKQKGRSQTVTGTATDADDITIGNDGAPGEYIVCVCDVPFHIRFGGGSWPTAAAPGSAVTGDMMFPANTLLRLYIPVGCTLMSLLREGATSGTFYWYLPG